MSVHTILNVYLGLFLISMILLYLIHNAMNTSERKLFDDFYDHSHRLSNISIIFSAIMLVSFIFLPENVFLYLIPLFTISLLYVSSNVYKLLKKYFLMKIS